MSATEVQAEAAIAILERMINAARNGNQAGEDAVVAAAAGPDLLAQMRKFADGAPLEKPCGPYDEFGGYSSDNYGDVIADACAEADWFTAEAARSTIADAIARATGAA